MLTSRLASRGNVQNTDQGAPWPQLESLSAEVHGIEWVTEVLEMAEWRSSCGQPIPVAYLPNTTVLQLDPSGQLLSLQKHVAIESLEYSPSRFGAAA